MTFIDGTEEGMAGDWIKVRTCLPDDPRIVRIADILDVDTDLVLGKLVRLWMHADQHTVDGVLPTMTPRAVDRLLRHPGFAAALVAIGWLEVKDGVAAIPRFHEHNGQTAKRRALDARRQRSARSKSNGKVDVTDTVCVTECGRERDGSVTECGRNADRSVTESKKEREKDPPHTPPQREREKSLSPGKPASKAANETDANADPAASPSAPDASRTPSDSTGVPRNGSDQAPAGTPSDTLGAPPRPGSDTAPAKPRRPAAKPKRPKEPPAPRPRDDLFDAVARVTGSDPHASGSYIGRVCSNLRKADPPYTPAEVESIPGIIRAIGWTKIVLTLGSLEKYIGFARTRPDLAAQQADKPRESAHEQMNRRRREEEEFQRRRLGSDSETPVDLYTYPP